jgi:hypothetical protein
MQKDLEHIGFSVLNEAIRQARHNALKVINAELVNLYWKVGAFVSKQLAQAEWGDKSVQKLSDFLLEQEPTLKGFDKRSIYRMVEFFEKYRFTAFVVPLNPQTHTAENQLNSIVVPLEPQLEKRLQNNVAIKLYKDKDVEVVEYALNRSLSPSLVAEYNTQLPNKKLLQQKLHELFERNILE